MSRALVLFAWLVGCRQNAVQPPAPVVDSHTALRDEARTVLEGRCGSCHISSYPTAAPPALAVFDLLDADWSHKMSEAQLRSALDRVKTGGGDVEMPSATPAQTQVVSRYVEAEIQRRTR
jgi:hypothetical protein